MGVFSPISETWVGIRTYLKGIRWLREHPKYFLILFIPIFLSIALVVLGFGYFVQYSEQLCEWLLYAKPDEFWWLALYYVVKSLLYVAVFAIGLISYLLLVNVFASPIYEYVSIAVERSMTQKPVEEISLWHSLLLMKEELKKVCFIVLISVSLLFVPGLNVLSPLITALIVGWDFYDYPMARRGLGFAQRFQMLRRNLWSVLGLGLWLVIPFVQILLMPLAVVGGTMLAIEDLSQQDS